MNRRLKNLVLILCVWPWTSMAQTTSRGPGKGPPSPGSGSKYTYPQPKKVTAVTPQQINPGFAVPDSPEKSVWRLTNKLYSTGSNPNDVPVYVIRNGRRALAGMASVGDEVTMEEIAVAADRIHYKFNWKGGAAPNPKFGTVAEYWVDGVNIEYSGKK